MEQLSEVTYCGIYCPNCGTRCRMPQKALALMETMKAGEWDDWGQGVEGFEPFWKFLKSLAYPKVTNRCREETCGHPACKIRKCAKDKGVEACPMCEDYPCELIQAFAMSEPTVIYDGKRMKEIGVEKWIGEQEARRQKDFCYDDLRCGKGNVPLE